MKIAPVISPATLLSVRVDRSAFARYGVNVSQVSNTHAALPTSAGTMSHRGPGYLCLDECESPCAGYRCPGSSIGPTRIAACPSHIEWLTEAPVWNALAEMQSIGWLKPHHNYVEGAGKQSAANTYQFTSMFPVPSGLFL